MTNREINFRAWDIENKKWIESFLIDQDGKLCLDDCRYMEGKFIIMQRTGLKDSKGKDIYENDITNNGVVKRFDGLHWDGGGSIHPGRYFDLSYNKDQELQYHTGFDNVEVLGNIYENPDLVDTM